MGLNGSRHSFPDKILHLYFVFVLFLCLVFVFKFFFKIRFFFFGRNLQGQRVDAGDRNVGGIGIHDVKSAKNQ